MSAPRHGFVRTVHPGRWRIGSAYADLVFRLDAILQRRIGVFEFTNDPDVVFRAALSRMEAPVELADGTRLAAGEQVIDLHLWNEQIPRIAASESSTAFAKLLQRRIRSSLDAVSRFLSEQPDLAAVRAIRADMALGVAAQSGRRGHLAARYGFETLPQRQDEPWRPLKSLGENILLAMLTLAQNPETFRWQSFFRDRVSIIMSRQKLERLYPPDPKRHSNPSMGREPSDRQ